ncbi:glycine/D-amino acid oxidase-like deaminating enzyme [Arthrobacter sp. PvP102]|jgi:glycine/D-amino acid oxidase-like deaminating enzyme|uniref:NAD(P)/FAD-dependent oxidoreductase n=1 Tax=unclassified Arthrobacter TaxID=235627 RepID=UPI001AE5818A|nr:MULTISPECIES: FAD-binding oxidoreductase [unclassified Arthrobacter]MBP1235449.1 glycine/D-amino acid oxidase-like deaminating enzyme [Arthrobacter sp. PvP103]MBP1236408.1 glycine/D-amino acid oxidase-like deaminating enzyme [Arthrobacter sp. PvP102]
MSSTASPKRVAVIGGGILGVSTAVHLLRQGASVVLLTERGLASEATGRSLSWLNSAGERSTPYHQLRLAGVDRYRTLFAADPGREWLQFDGGLMWNAAGQSDATESRHAYEKSVGYDSKLLAPEEIAAVTPGIDSRAIADNAIFNPGEGWVSLPDLVDFLMEEFHTRGGELVLNAGKASVTVNGGRATGVATTGGKTYEAGTVLVACGAATPAVVAPLGVHIPNGSPVSMLVLTKPVDHSVRAVMNTPRAAVRPNPGNTLALDHDWYEDRITEHGDGQFSIPDDVVQELADEASKLIAGNPELKPASWKIGYKPIPGDGEPVLGELGSVPGCFVAFTHSGATLGLIAGELLAGEIMTGNKHPMLATFRAERFS